jgi:hypothetical protein
MFKIFFYKYTNVLTTPLTSETIEQFESQKFRFPDQISKDETLPILPINSTNLVVAASTSAGDILPVLFDKSSSFFYTFENGNFEQLKVDYSPSLVIDEGQNRN